MCAAPIKRFLGADNALARLQDHAARLLRLQGQIGKLLPAGMREGVRVANYEDGILTLHVVSPAMASRLKLSQESLRQDLMGLNEAVLGIKIKVRALHSSERGGLHARETRQIGAQGRTALKDLSEKLDAGSPLGKALTRMLKDSK